MIGRKYTIVVAVLCITVSLFVFLNFMEITTMWRSNPKTETMPVESLNNYPRTLREIRDSVALQYEAQKHSEKGPDPFMNHVYDSVMLDFEDLPGLTGPRTEQLTPSKRLVVICIGKDDKVGVNNLVTNYFSDSSLYSFMLFHYDTATYNEFDWYNQLNVVAIRILHKMKFWYLKRFLTPNVAKAFSHIIILDGDVDFEKPFDPTLYTKVADSFGLALSQPAHFVGSTTLHENIKLQNGDHVGRYTDFVECGPAVFMKSEAYQCVYHLLQPDLTSGWGLDVLWVDFVKNFCGFGEKSVAVLDAFVLIHSTPSSQGTASSNAGFNSRAWGEVEVFKQRFPWVKEGWGQTPTIPFGHKNCLHTDNPASSTSCS